MTTPEQQAQVDQWRKEAEQMWVIGEFYHAARESPVQYSDREKCIAIAANLAGREAQQREDAGEIERFKKHNKILQTGQNDLSRAYESAARTMTQCDRALLEKEATIAQLQAEIERLRTIVPEVLEELNEGLCKENDELRAQVKELESRLAELHKSERRAYENFDAMHSRALVAQSRLDACEPVDVQFQSADGKWHGFIDDKHREATIAHGGYPIRKLYLAPQPAAQVPDAPVAWRSRHVNYVGWTLSEWELPIREGQEQQPLYLDRRCATIPDSLHMRDVTHPKATNPEEAWMYAAGWNACRAAMIEGEKK